MNPLVFVLLCLAGWMNRSQQEVIEYLQEEIRVLKELLGKKPRFKDDQRRRLAIKGQAVRQEDPGSICESGHARHLAGMAPPLGGSEI